ncbi:MAG: type II toxin-antitoxin system HicA family toxin [Candidatus Stahlbacteria bacterium]|nr:type II toxin-antitoxin system HicA family toxin [Candidatus Stahlbacteria bacterium]
MKALTGKEMVALLEKDGWYVVRIKGSHHIMTKKNSKIQLSIPVHAGKDLKPGLQNHFLKIAGIKFI